MHMKKDGARKLALKRETLKSLQDEDLKAANGGDSFSISASGYSISVSNSNSQSQSVSFSGYSWSVSISGSH
jgi:hypothetical protein